MGETIPPTGETKPAKFEPLVRVNKAGIRRGVMPSGKERGIGIAGLVSIPESLRIYRAELHRQRFYVDLNGTVAVEHEGGLQETWAWSAGRPKEETS